LLFGSLVKGGAVRVGLKDNALSFDYTEAKMPSLVKVEEGDDSGKDGSEKESESAE